MRVSGQIYRDGWNYYLYIPSDRYYSKSEETKCGVLALVFNSIKDSKSDSEYPKYGVVDYMHEINDIVFGFTSLEHMEYLSGYVFDVGLFSVNGEITGGGIIRTIKDNIIKIKNDVIDVVETYNERDVLSDVINGVMENKINGE